MYYVYVLENQTNQGWYVGYSADLKKRITEHNSDRGGQTTRRNKNWKLIYYEAYLNKNDAVGREKFLKSGSGWKFLKKQLVHYLSNE